MKRPSQVWLLWIKSKTLHTRPSELLNLEPDGYDAWCLDEAVIYFGLTLEGKLEEAGQKPSKEERKARAARERIMNNILGEDDEKKKTAGYADPALMFG